MRDRELYAQILGIVRPWRVVDVKLDTAEGEVTVHVRLTPKTELSCPTCGKMGRLHDHRERRWRHLDTCQFRTMLVAEIPRVSCAEHGVHQISVPWSEPRSGFTALFEALVIDWLKEASVAAVARQLNMTWDEVDGVMMRAVKRGLARRGPVTARRIGVDETSFQKRHEYVTVVSQQSGSRVLYVADGRRAKSLDGFYESLSDEERKAIEVVAMDMSAAYINSTRRHVPEADEKIAFDRFHVAKLLTKAVDKVRREEHRQLTAEGDPTLKGSRYVWVMNPENMKPAYEETLSVLRSMSLKTARAWALKEMARTLWRFVRRGWAEKAWKKWVAWAVRSRLEPMKQAARTIRQHLQGILNAIVLKCSNAGAESINAKVQKVKQMACGFRNRERFRNAIYFHLGGLDLYPESLQTSHTNS